MQNTHTLSKRIAAGKHDLDSCKNIFNICTPIMFSGNKRSAAQFFFLFLKHCHLNMNPKYSEWNSGFQDKRLARWPWKHLFFWKVKSQEGRTEMACFILFRAAVGIV